MSSLPPLDSLELRIMILEDGTVDNCAGRFKAGTGCPILPWFWERWEARSQRFVVPTFRKPRKGLSFDCAQGRPRTEKQVSIRLLPLRVSRSGQALVPLVKARDFGITPSFPPRVPFL